MDCKDSRGFTSNRRVGWRYSCCTANTEQSKSNEGLSCKSAKSPPTGSSTSSRIQGILPPITDPDALTKHYLGVSKRIFTKTKQGGKLHITLHQAWDGHRPQRIWRGYRRNCSAAGRARRSYDLPLRAWKSSDRKPMHLTRHASSAVLCNAPAPWNLLSNQD